MTTMVAPARGAAAVRCGDIDMEWTQAPGGKGDARLVLTTEDLAASSREFGISLKKPTYYADTPGPGGSSGPPPTAGQP